MKYLSDCCHAELITRGGLPDFPSDKCAVTIWVECNKCKQPCGIYVKERKIWNINPKTRVVPNKKKDRGLSKKEINEILKSEDF